MKLIDEKIKSVNLHMTLKMFLNMQMRDAKGLPPAEKWNYNYIKEQNQKMIKGEISPQETMQNIWNWHKQNENIGDTFSWVDLYLLAKKYGLKLQ